MIEVHIEDVWNAHLVFKINIVFILFYFKDLQTSMFPQIPH